MNAEGGDCLFCTADCVASTGRQSSIVSPLVALLACHWRRETSRRLHIGFCRKLSGRIPLTIFAMVVSRNLLYNRLPPTISLFKGSTLKLRRPLQSRVLTQLCTLHSLISEKCQIPNRPHFYYVKFSNGVFVP